MSKAVIVSFYTPEWQYKSRAEALMRDCDRLGLPHDIRPRASLKNWNRNTAMKPRFIQEVMQDHHHIIWLDCDGRLYQRPELCCDQHPKQVPILAVAHQTMRAHTTTPRNWHTGLLSIRNIPAARLLVERWASSCDENDYTDELAFHMVTKGDEDAVLRLPGRYLQVRQMGSAPGDTVYNLGISEAPDKLAMKERQRARGGKRD